jgi:hypothetical protein
VARGIAGGQIIIVAPPLAGNAPIIPLFMRLRACNTHPSPPLTLPPPLWHQTRTPALQVVNNTIADEVYVLYQCGAGAPPRAAFPEGTKFFQVPLTSISAPETVPYAFLVRPPAGLWLLALPTWWLLRVLRVCLRNRRPEGLQAAAWQPGSMRLQLNVPGNHGCECILAHFLILILLPHPISATAAGQPGADRPRARRVALRHRPLRPGAAAVRGALLP